MKFDRSVCDQDYIGLYADSMRSDSSLFEQQRKLIDSQIDSSVLLFKRKFGSGSEFKEKARDFLRKIGLLK